MLDLSMWRVRPKVHCRVAVPAIAMLAAVALPQWSRADGHTTAASGSGHVILAQKEDPKKKGQPKQAPKMQSQPNKGGTHGAQKQFPPKKSGPPQNVQQQVQPNKGSTPHGAQKQFPPKKSGPPQNVQQQMQPRRGGPSQNIPKQAEPKRSGPPPNVQKQVEPKKTGPQNFRKAEPQKKGPIQTRQPKFVQPKGGLPRGNVEQIRTQRKVRVETNGRRVIEEPGNRLIIHERNRIIIRHDDSARLRRWGNARFEVRGRERYTILRRGSFEIVTVTDVDGRLLRRYRRYPDGREVIFIDNRPRTTGVFLRLAPPRITIPRERYIVSAVGAPPALLFETLAAPPLVAIERPYSLDEIRYNVELRNRMRSIDIDTLNFESGSWTITPDQYPKLQLIAAAIQKLIERNPNEVVLIEGHTDAVGSPEDNLSLSDRRAEAVADILTGEFQIPPENLVTQGYGEQHLKVPTEGPSRENRRAVVRRITPLLAGGNG